MMPLSFAEIGQPQIIKRIGGNPETKKHLEDLGFEGGSQSENTQRCKNR